MRYTISCLMASLFAAPTFADVPKVVTDIVPVHALVSLVMGDLGAPLLLLERGADEHDFALKPSQMQAVAGADLVVWIDPGLTPWLARALNGAGAGAVSLPLLTAAGTATRDYEDHHDHAEADADAEGEAHTEGEEHAEGEAHTEGEEHAETGVDPHAWLDPGNAQLWLGHIARALARIDPGNATTYTANSALAQARIAAVDLQVAAILQPVKDRPFVVFHDAYGYFEAHYGVKVAGSVALGDASAPGAARLAALADQVGSGGVLCLFPEVQHDPVLVLQMAGDARVGGALDPAGAMLEPGPLAYEALLLGLANTLADCLS